VGAARLGLPEERWLEPALVLNFHPASYVHESWLGSIPHRRVIELLREEPASAIPVSRHLMDALELDRSYCEDFSTPFARLALMDGNAVARLYFYVGIALRSDELRGQIVGHQVRAVKEVLGAEAYAFGVRTSPLLGRIPAFPFEPEAGDQTTRLCLIGARYCWSHLSPKPEEAVLRRALLKLPAYWEPYLSTAWDGPESRGSGENLPQIVDRVLKEVLPEWRPLFA